MQPEHRRSDVFRHQHVHAFHALLPPPAHRRAQPSDAHDQVHEQNQRGQRPDTLHHGGPVHSATSGGASARHLGQHEHARAR